MRKRTVLWLVASSSVFGSLGYVLCRARKKCERPEDQILVAFGNSSRPDASGPSLTAAGAQSAGK